MMFLIREEKFGQIAKGHSNKAYRRRSKKEVKRIDSGINVREVEVHPCGKE